MKTLKAAIIILTIAVLMASSVNAYAAYTHEYVGAQVKSYASSYMTAKGKALNSDMFMLGTIAPDVDWPNTHFGTGYPNKAFGLQLLSIAKTNKNAKQMSFALGWLAHDDTDQALDDYAKLKGVDFGNSNNYRLGADFISYHSSPMSLSSLNGLLDSDIVNLIASATGSSSTWVYSKLLAVYIPKYQSGLSGVSAVATGASFALCPGSSTSPLSSSQLAARKISDFNNCVIGHVDTSHLTDPALTIGKARTDTISNAVAMVRRTYATN